MIISIESSNPDLGWIISKNPESLPLAKTIRKGSAMGWFSNPQSYHLAFFECLRSTGNVSWGRKPEDDFAYLYEGEYCDPFLGLSLINEFIKDASIKPLHEKDIPSDHKITIASIRVSQFIYKIEKFLNLNYRVVNKSDHWENYQVIEFYNHGTLKELVSNVMMFLLFLSLNERESIDINVSLVEKYIKLINELNIPYYPRSLFKLKIGMGNKELISKLNTSSIQMDFYDSHRNRIEFTVDNAMAGYSVLDLGCGEFRHGKRLAKIASNYIGVDTNPDCIEESKSKAKRNFIENVEFYSSIEEIPRQDIETIVCSEVIEHLESVQAVKELLTIAVNKFNPKRLVITTPNKTFNTNYMLGEDEFRHDDHKFELTKEEFQELMSEIFNEIGGYSLDFVGVGDKVDGESCTSGVVIKKVS